MTKGYNTPDRVPHSPDLSPAIEIDAGPSSREVRLAKGKRLKSVASLGLSLALFAGALPGMTGQHRFQSLEKGQGNVAPYRCVITLGHIQRWGSRIAARL